ncbi:MAG: beta-xylosidase [Pseudonocardiales bacterium]|jgi:beta-glucosidase-like glycosyl hydrolase|nr:beta-xylosidase [Pseudonocardiales bacterium]
MSDRGAAGRPRPARDRHVRELLDRMTLAEKIGQISTVMLPSDDDDARALVDRPPGIVLVPASEARRSAARIRAVQDVLARSGTGVPALPIAIGHGAGWFRGALGAAATWDVAAVERLAAEEAAALRAAGVLATLGAVAVEGQDAADGPPRADPMLAAAMATAQVRGAQGRDTGRAGLFGPEHVAVIVPLGVGRDGSWHERTLRSTLLTAAEAAVRAGAAIVMPTRASNAGVPGHTDSWMLRDVLRRDWGFTGVVMAAEGAVHGLVTHHEIAGDLTEAIATAVEAGVDVVGSGADVVDRLITLVETGALPRWIVDDSVAAVLHVKDRLGLLDPDRRRPPSAVPPSPGASSAPAHLSVARTLVLLSDPMGALPLSGAEEVHVVAADAVHETGGPVGGQDGGASPDAHELAGALKVLLPGALVHAGLPGAGDPVAGSTVVVLAPDPVTAAPLAGRVVAAGRRCVVLVCTDRVDALDELAPTTATIVLCWGPVRRDVVAVAEVLTGTAEPEGRLPLGLPVAPTPRSVVFPLGHGSGYTTFRYSRLRIAPAVLLGRETVQVRCIVTNTGHRPGRDIVQVYLEHLTSTIAMPGRSLAGFAPVRLGVGQSLPVVVQIPPERLAVWDRAMRHTLQPGSVDVLVGSSAADIQLSGTLTIGSSGALGPGRCS